MEYVIKNTVLIGLPIIAALWFVITIVWGGIAYENYNHMSQFISELGATGASTSAFINYIGFIPTQLLILLFIIICANKLPQSPLNTAGLLLLCVYTFSLTTAAIFPCDFECRPETPTKSHVIHILSAIPAYLSGSMAIFILSKGLKKWAPSKAFEKFGYAISILILICFFNLDDSSQYVGLIQRILEASIFLWFILFAQHINKHRQTLNERKSKTQ